MDHDLFYRSFEELHRGPRTLIKERLEPYLSFIFPLHKIYPEAKVLDIGCGRGEWLELLDEQGIQGVGVDLDEGMLEACHGIGLNVEKQDGIVYLQAQPAESFMAISAFHVVEHIPFEHLQMMIEEAKRVLVPGGVLILETPNPENLTVGTERFYFDPTHLRPIPSPLLSFLPEFYGYARTKNVRLHEPDVTHAVGLSEVLEGVSPDYAVIAQKGDNNGAFEGLDELFEQEHGLSLQWLSGKFDEYQNERVDRANERIADLDEGVQALDAHIQQLDAHIQQLFARNARLEETLTSTTEAYYNVLNSRSWRITKPLRETVALFKIRLPSLLQRFARRVRSNPKLKQPLLKILDRTPSLKRRLKRFVDETPIGGDVGFCAHRGPDHLSPHAKQVLETLKTAIEERKSK